MELVAAAGDASVGRRLSVAEAGDIGGLARTINRLFDALGERDEEIQDRDRLFMDFARTLPEVVLVHDERILLANESAAALVGLTPDQLEGREVADPLPQALALTAIVISFGLTAFLLALAYRSWQLTGDDLVEDDVEDRRIAARTADVDEEVVDVEVLGVDVTIAADDGKGCSKETSLDVTCTPDCDALPTSDFRTPCNAAGDHVDLAEGLSVSYATRDIANNTDQFVFWPHESSEPTHLVFCTESSREELADGRLQPSVQVMDLASREIHTVVRGMVGCDGIRTTPWGTVLATEEFADDNGGLYEILLDPESDAQYSVAERGENGASATVVEPPARGPMPTPTASQ